MSKIKVEAYIEESEFKNDKGENIKFLSLLLPVTDDTEKRIKADQFVLSLAKERATKKNISPFSK